MNRLRRPARSYNVLAASMVLFASCARSGETSSETHPSTPSVRSWMGREEIGGAPKILDREIEEESFTP